MVERAQTPDDEAQFIESEIRPSTAVIEATAEFLDRDPLDLEPLERCVDPDALDGLFGGGDAGGGDAPGAARSGKVDFEYHGVEVSVDFGAEEGFRVELSESHH